MHQECKVEDEQTEVSEVPAEPIKKSPDLRLTVAKMFGILPKYVTVNNVRNNDYRVTILEYKEVLLTQRLVYKESYFVTWVDGEIISSNPEFPKN